MTKIVIDIDDFCNATPCLDDLLQLRVAYPRFRATLFTIPEQTSVDLLEAAQKLTWLEIAVHGFCHVPNHEMSLYDEAEVRRRMKQVPWRFFAQGFKAPGWQITQATITVCNEFGLWVALHERDTALMPLCQHGYYACRGQRPADYQHFHTHDVCGNWIHQMLPKLLTQWDKEQEFCFVSEALVLPQSNVP